jgi:VWFA-related protein
MPIRFVAVLLILVPSLCAFSQEERRPRPVAEEVEVELQQLTFRVSDAQGGWMSGIGKDDVELLINGKKEEVLYLDEMRFGEQPQQQTPGYAPPVVQNLVVFVLDTSSTRPRSIVRHKDFLKKLIGGFPSSGISYSVVSITPSGTFETIQDLTEDRSAALASIQDMDSHLRGGAEEWEVQLSRIMDPSRTENCMGLSSGFYMDCVEGAIGSAVQSAAAYGRVLQAKQARSFAAFERLLKGISRLPGNKTVIVVSQGIDPLVGAYMERAVNAVDELADSAGMTMQQIEALRRSLDIRGGDRAAVADSLHTLVETLGKANTSIYWVSTEKSGITSALDMGGRSLLSPEGVKGELAGRHALERLAEDTGGAAYSAKDLESAYLRLSENLSSYYLLSYRSKTAKEDVVQAVVHIKKGNREVSLLRNPIRPPTEDQTSGSAHLIDSSVSLEIGTDTHYFTKKKGEYIVRVGVGVPATSLMPDEKGGRIKDEILFRFQVVDEAGKTAFDGEGKAPVDASIWEFTSMQDRNSTIEYVQRFNLRQGKYKLLVTATEKKSGRSNSENHTLLLPETESSCPQITPLVLATRVTPSNKHTQNPEFTREGGILFSDRLYEIGTSRSFPASGALDGFYQVFGAKGQSLLVSFKLYRGTALVNGTTPRPIGGAGQDIFTNHFSIPYKNLDVGDYAFEAVITTPDSRCTATTQASFQVVEQM